MLIERWWPQTFVLNLTPTSHILRHKPLACQLCCSPESAGVSLRVRCSAPTPDTAIRFRVGCNLDIRILKALQVILKPNKPNRWLGSSQAPRPFGKSGLRRAESAAQSHSFQHPAWLLSPAIHLCSNSGTTGTSSTVFAFVHPTYAAILTCHVCTEYAGLGQICDPFKWFNLVSGVKLLLDFLAADLAGAERWQWLRPDPETPGVCSLQCGRKEHKITRTKSLTGHNGVCYNKKGASQASWPSVSRERETLLHLAE